MNADDGYIDGIRSTTEFKENGFGIDPDGCGCTDCITGQAFHVSEVLRIKVAINQGRRLYNRSSQEVILPNGYRLNDGQSYRLTNSPRAGSEEYASFVCHCGTPVMEFVGLNGYQCHDCRFGLSWCSICQH